MCLGMHCLLGLIIMQPIACCKTIDVLFAYALNIMFACSDSRCPIVRLKANSSSSAPKHPTAVPSVTHSLGSCSYLIKTQNSFAGDHLLSTAGNRHGLAESGKISQELHLCRSSPRWQPHHRVLLQHDPPTYFSTGSSTATTSPSFPWISSNPSKDLLISRRRARSLLLPGELLLRLS